MEFPMNRTDTMLIPIIDGEVAGPVTSHIPTYLGEPMLPPPGRARYVVRRTVLARVVTYLALLLAAAVNAVLHPETANPRPRTGFVVGTALACLFIVSYAIAHSGGVR